MMAHSDPVKAVAAAALAAVGAATGCSPSGQMTRSFWYVGSGNQFRVNSPDTAEGRYRDRWEAKKDGRMILRVEDDLRHVARAWLYLELWGGHPGVADKRVTINGKGTYSLPEVGASDKNCTYSYPQIEIRPGDLAPGENALQFACDKGTSFWGHYIVRAACLRLELRDSHPMAAGLGRGAAVQAEANGEMLSLRLDAPEAMKARIARVVYFARYSGYDDNGDGDGNDWHGATMDSRPAGCIGQSDAAPYQAQWDMSMVPDQASIDVRADVYLSGDEGLVYRTPAVTVPMPRRPARVVLLGPGRLPQPFWSRAGNRKSCVIDLPVGPDSIERAQLHVVVWDGGKGGVERPLSINDTPLDTPGWKGAHVPIHTVLDVPPAALRQGTNTVALLSDTQHHGIEICLPGPALVVRLKPTATASGKGGVDGQPLGTDDRGRRASGGEQAGAGLPGGG